MHKNVVYQTNEKCFYFIQMKKRFISISIFCYNLVFITLKENLGRACSSVGFDIMKFSNKRRVF